VSHNGIVREKEHMKKVISLLMIYAVLAFSIPIPSQAQVANPPNTVLILTGITASATCATTACPTFTIPPNMCTGVVTVTGTNSVLSVVTQVSTNKGTTFGPAVVNVVGLAGTGAPAALTGSVIVANGNYWFTAPTMSRVRFLINTLTGTNVTFNVTMFSACAVGL
jgi:hypothetical protein